MITKKGNIEFIKYAINDIVYDNKYEFIAWYTVNGRKCSRTIAFAERNGGVFEIRSETFGPWKLNEHDFNDYNDLVKIFYEEIVMPDLKRLSQYD